LQRLSASPAAAVALLKLYRDTDIRGLLPAVSVPTLVLHRLEDQLDPISLARLTASLVPEATLVELSGDDHYWVVGWDDIVEEVEEFVTGNRRVTGPDRVLATVLFTDIVGSTNRASAMGDRDWRELLAAHDQEVRRELRRFGGLERGTAGDGFFATFDGPARAVRSALAIGESVRALGLEVRAGVHTGEVELADDEVRGIAVHIGARVAALAGASEVLVSSTVKDLVAGSGLVFEDAGEHELKGVPDHWHLYRVLSG
jgi:class 3 adenylate cyclase